MIVILAILAATRASPIAFPSSPFVSRDLFQNREPLCDDLDGCRSLWDIIRGCLVTISLCTWVSMHPNIPSPDERWPTLARRRAGLMLLALFVPEAVIAWAARQRLIAIKLAKMHKEEGWTTTHGFFAIMGGFMEYEGNQPIRVLLPDELESYSLTGNGDFPRISKADIEDKSKGDAISKGLVLLQTTWFVVQFIARGVQGLPVLGLELVTVAFATLNLIIYLLWWDKPQNVKRGVRVYKKRKTEEEVDDGDAEEIVGFWVALCNSLSHLPTKIVRGPVPKKFKDSPWLIRVLMWPLFKPMDTIFPEDDTDDIVLLKRVNTFYPHQWNWSLGYLSSAEAAVSATIVGFVYWPGWSYDFPSSLEQMLWRVAFIAMTGVPIILLLALGLRFSMNKFLNLNLLDSFCMRMIWILLLLFFLLGRLTVFVIPCLGLTTGAESLPPSLFYNIHWSSFIPHI